MTNDQINALAREYAVEVTKDMAKNLDESSCLLNETINQTTEYCSDFLKWLSESYCIVEQSKLKEAHKQATVAINWGDRGSDYFYGDSIIETLFPELFEDKEE